VMIGRQYPEVAQHLAQQLQQVLLQSNKRIGIIVSTDLSHYYNSDKAERMDSLILKYIMGFDPDALWQSIVSRRCEACGIGGIMTLLVLANALGNANAKIINYTHSGKVSGDNQQVVGYLSALIYR